jgi:hypothetical protein
MSGWNRLTKFFAAKNVPLIDIITCVEVGGGMIM